MTLFQTIKNMARFYKEELAYQIREYGPEYAVVTGITLPILIAAFVTGINNQAKSIEARANREFSRPLITREIEAERYDRPLILRERGQFNHSETFE